MASHKDPVAVIGLGRFGTALALELVRTGTEVLAIHHQPDIVQRLTGHPCQVAIADYNEIEALQ